MEFIRVIELKAVTSLTRSRRCLSRRIPIHEATNKNIFDKAMFRVWLNLKDIWTLQLHIYTKFCSASAKHTSWACAFITWWKHSQHFSNTFRFLGVAYFVYTQSRNDITIHAHHPTFTEGLKTNSNLHTHTLPNGVSHFILTLGTMNWLQTYFKTHFKSPQTHPTGGEGGTLTLTWGGGGVALDPGTYIHTYIHLCICTCIHTYIHTCMHTYIHM